MSWKNTLRKSWTADDWNERFHSHGSVEGAIESYGGNSEFEDAQEQLGWAMEKFLDKAEETNRFSYKGWYSKDIVEITNKQTSETIKLDKYWATLAGLKEGRFNKSVWAWETMLENDKFWQTKTSDGKTQTWFEEERKELLDSGDNDFAHLGELYHNR